MNNLTSKDFHNNIIDFVTVSAGIAYEDCKDHKDICSY